MNTPAPGNIPWAAEILGDMDYAMFGETLLPYGDLEKELLFYSMVIVYMPFLSDARAVRAIAATLAASL
jgi:hypothetical protein